MQNIRLRRLRETALLRNWVSEAEISAKNIIIPYFAVEGRNVKEPIDSMPGVYRFSIDNLIEEIAQTKGLKAILLFGIPKAKDILGTSAYQKNGITQKAIREIKKNFKHLIVISDVCLCAFTTHGHCGIIKNKSIDNGQTVKLLAKTALSHAEAGADFTAPSAMMDGQVAAIRKSLDKNGFKNVGILAYSAKYASNFYGPFREALNSKPSFGDRKSHQLDFRNAGAALREIKQDIDEGADIIMVKPALAYLDIIFQAKQKFNLPLAAYNVSGEYTAIKKLSNGDKEQEKGLILESLTAIKRAGADFIITYFGKQILQWLD